MKEKNIKEYIQEILKKLDKDKLKIIFTTSRDWGVLLIVFFILLIFLFVINTYFFIYYNKEGAFLKIFEEVEEVEIMKTEELNRTIELFENKESTFNKLLEDKPSIVDPSL